MPKNNKLRPVKLPMELKFNKKPTTIFKNNLDSIKIELMSAPTLSDLVDYLPQFVCATWSPEYNSNDKMQQAEMYRVIVDTIEGKALPTALETIRLTFRISGISLQEVTHIIRYRTASFSADCSGDKWWTDKAALIPNSIENSNGKLNDHDKDEYKYLTGQDDPTDFHARYEALVKECKQLYTDMIDSKQISIMDARYILPRCLETFYYMSMSLKDAIAFIRQRVDRQIQPETDNVIAYLMLDELLDRYPIFESVVDLHAPSSFYAKMARTGKATNLYFPDKDSDVFEWNEEDFIYQHYRDEMNGTDPEALNYFNEVFGRIERSINRKREAWKQWYKQIEE